MKYVKIILVLLLTILSLNIPKNEVEALAYIPDENLKACLGRYSNISTEPTIADLNNNWQYINCQSRNITDITGIEHLTNTEIILLDNNNISDISIINWDPLTSLEKLSMWGNEIDNITPLNGLVSLKELNLNDNKISDISPLENLSNLDFLNLSRNEVSDISPLSDLTSLTDLNLSSNQIGTDDLSNLNNLSNLNTLSLSYNYIRDISILTSLTSLEHLYLHDNQVIDITPLEQLINLKSLDLGLNQYGWTKISDVSSLSNLTNLEYLRIYRASIDDISVLSNLVNLKDLRLQENRISDISVIENFKKLEFLNLDYNDISDISALEELTNLGYLNLPANEISDISALSNLVNLKVLDLNYNSISDITALEKITGLQYLSLRSNQISDISAVNEVVGEFPHLYTLYLNNQSITLPNVTVDTSPYKTGKVIVDIDDSLIEYTDNPEQTFTYDGQTALLISRWDKTVSIGNANTTFSGSVRENVTYAMPSLLLDANNFSIHINNLNNLDDLKAKTEAALTSSQGSTNLFDSVTVDPDELSTIKNTASKGVFDLTFNIVNNGSSETRTIKVFVIDDNDLVDETNDIVLMADDFQVDLNDTDNYSNGITDSNAIAYKYSDGSILPTNNINVNHTNINNASSVGPVNVIVSYSDSIISVNTTVIASVVDEYTAISNENSEAIYAKDFIIHINQLDSLDNDKIKELADNAFGWNMNDGTFLILNVNYKNILQQVGTYDVIFSSEKGTARTIKVTVIDDDTVIEESIAITAHNFAINIDEVENLTDSDIQSSANVYAWNIVNGNTIPQITVDQTEFSAIKNATIKGLYPLTFSTSENNTVVSKTITVFIIDDYDVIDNGKVLYVDKDKIVTNTENAQSLTFENIVELTNARAYEISTAKRLDLMLKQPFDLQIINNGESGSYELVIKANPEKTIYIAVTGEENPLPPTGNIYYITYSIILVLILLLFKLKAVKN